MSKSHGILMILLAAILWGTTGTSQALAPSGAQCEQEKGAAADCQTQCSDHQRVEEYCTAPP